MFTMSRDNEITQNEVLSFIKRHQHLLQRYQKLADYYSGRHDILCRNKKSNLANNRIVCNHAKHISDTATGYMAGNPIRYKSRLNEQTIDTVTEWMRIADADTQDMDVAKYASIFGIGCELVYMSDEESPTPRLASFDPRNAFVVYDDTVDRKPLFGVYYYPVFDEAGAKNGYAGKWYTDRWETGFRMDTGFSIIAEEEPARNNFGEVPLIEYYNNEECQGDFEQVIELIDAYNLLQSDRVNDKQQFVEAILLLKGATLGDDDKERRDAYEDVKRNGVLELDEPDASAEWLIRTFDESSVEVLRRSIEQDIHRFSGVPCMDDEHFAGNTSGVAMRYKLLGFEQVVKIKERYFREGLKIRLRLFCNILSTKGTRINPNDIDIVFSRNLPANEAELAQIVATLQGMVPDQTLLSILPFVEDAKAAAEELRMQREEAARQQQEAFAAAANTPPEDVTEDEE